MELVGELYRLAEEGIAQRRVMKVAELGDGEAVQRRRQAPQPHLDAPHGNVARANEHRIGADDERTDGGGAAHHKLTSREGQLFSRIAPGEAARRRASPKAMGPVASASSPSQRAAGSLLISAQRNKAIGTSTTAASPRRRRGTRKRRGSSVATRRRRQSESRVMIELATRSQA